MIPVFGHNCSYQNSVRIVCGFVCIQNWNMANKLWTIWKSDFTQVKKSHQKGQRNLWWCHVCRYHDCQHMTSTSVLFVSHVQVLIYSHFNVFLLNLNLVADIIHIIYPDPKTTVCCWSQNMEGFDVMAKHLAQVFITDNVPWLQL